MELVAQESVKRGAIDLSAQMAKLQQANLDVLWVVLVPGPGAMALKEAKKAGWTKTKLLAAGPVTDEKFIILSGGEGEGVWGFSVWPDPVHSKKPAVAEYRKMLEKYAQVMWPIVTASSVISTGSYLWKPCRELEKS